MQSLAVFTKLNKLILRPSSSHKLLAAHTKCVRNFSSTTTTAVKKEPKEKKMTEKPPKKPTMSRLVVGQTYHQFECKESQFYQDFNMTAYLLQHERMHTKYLHITRQDPNNLFSVNFRTPVSNSRGVPHILEHMALCGSELYPVRDPFFKMTTRSLATFMNAMTGPDYTIYPFSSTNERDFRNLQKVYLDAVFQPHLRHLDFLQEGWRLEQTDLNDVNSPLALKGVVFNEMKGSFATSHMLLCHFIMKNLYPNNAYGHSSGGWPLDIVSLTWEELVAFYRKHYHPSNARLFSYGNFDVLQSLQYVNEQYLSKCEPLDELSFSQVQPHERWTEPRECTMTGRYDAIAGPIEKQNQIAISYLMSDINDPYEALVLNVIGSMLTKGPNSSFYKSLIQPNVIGGSFSPLTGYDSTLKDTTFLLGLQNIKESDFALVEKLVAETIDDVIANGFDAEHLQSVLHRLELNIKRQRANFGLELLFSVTSTWNHDSNILDALNIAKHFEQLKENLKDGTYLQRKVKQYFKDNSHRLVLKMLPNENYETEMQAAEKYLLDEKVAKLTAADREKIQKTAQELLVEQQQPAHNTHLLPCLSMNDITDDIEELNVQHIVRKDIPVQLNLVNTNQLVYLKGIFFANHLSDDEKLLLPLLALAFPKMGTRTYSYDQFDKMINLKTGGISFDTHFATNINELNYHELGLQISSHCLEENVDDMLALVKEMLLNFEMVDVKRFAVLLDDYVNAITSDVSSMGHQYAMQSSAALVMNGSKLKANLCGLEHIALTKKLYEQNSPEEILLKLQNLARHLFGNCQMKYALNMGEKSRTNVMKKFDTFAADIESCVDKSQHHSTPKWIAGKQIPGESGVIPCVHTVANLPVNFCGKSLLAVPYTNKLYSPLRVLAKLLTAKYLLPTVREQNGAYGAGARFDVDGLFQFYSYRDPSNRQTLDAFDDSLNWLKNNWDSIDQQTIFEAKLGVLQAMDAPKDASAKGLSEFQYGITAKLFRTNRERVIGTTKEALMKAAERYLKKTDYQLNTSGKSVLGPLAIDSLKRDGEEWIVNEFS